METCDALIVGGGPAGSSCAWKLRQHGMDVMVMDKAPFPARQGLCRLDYAGGGGGAAAGYRGLCRGTGAAADHGLSHRPDPRPRAGDPISGHGQLWHTPLRVRRLPAAALGGAPAAGPGAEIHGKARQQWMVNDAITTPLVIGAGGHFCPVARFMGAKLGASEPAVTAKEIEFEMSPAQRDDCRVRGGYAGTLFLPGYEGIRLVFSQRRLSEYRAGTGGQPGSFGTPRAFLRFPQATRQNPAGHPGQVPWPCLSAVRTCAPQTAR